MGGAIKVYTPGRSGVIIDHHPLSPGVPDDSFQLAQNMTHESYDGKADAVCKRPGLARFNVIGLGDAVLGGIPMPVAGFGGAPETGGGGFAGFDPDAVVGVGTGDGTGGMGGTFDGGAAEFGSVGASLFGGGSGGSGNIFGGARLLVIGYSDTATLNDGVGWYVTSKYMANTANLVTSPGPPGAAYGAINQAASLLPLGRPNAVTADNFCFYSDANSVSVNTARQIRKTNGAVDQAVGTIPLSLVMAGGGSVQMQQVMSMHYGDDDGAVYVAVSDELGANISGRIMKISGGVITEVNPGAAGAITRYARTPYCMAKHEGRLFWGTFRDIDDTTAEVNCTTLDQTYSVSDLSSASVSGRQGAMTCMISAGGVLYVGTRVRTAGTPAHAGVLCRPIGAAPGAGGWNEYNPLGLDTSNPTPANLNTIVSLAYFNGAVYASWYNSSSTLANIYRLVPDNSNPSIPSFTTASSVSFHGTAAGDRVGYTLFVDDGVLYAFGQRNQTTARKFMWTVDGTTWTDASANFPHPTTEYPNPIIFGLDQ